MGTDDTGGRKRDDRRVRVLVVVAAVAVFAAGCTETVVGSGTLAAEVYVPPSRSSPVASPPTPAPTTPRSAPTTPRAPAVARIPAAFAGTWTGPVRQPIGVIKNWTAMLVLPRGGQLGTFTIAGYCRGLAAVVSAGRTKLVLREVITSDPRNRCAASGIITLVPASGRLRFSWVDSARGDNKASGTLTRR